MNLLWLALGLLLLPALWLLILPLRQARGVHDTQQAYEREERTTEQNVAVYRQRLASLEAAHARGEIDTARFDDSRLELDRSLLEDAESQRRAPLRAPAAGRLLVPLVMLALVVVSVIWYQREGAEGDLALYAAQQSVRQAPDGSLPMLVGRLEEQATLQPDNPNVWLALFPLYRDSGQLDKAIHALNRLIALQGREPGLLAQLAQSKFFVASRTLTDEVQALVDETLAAQPHQPTVMGMLGIDAFDHGRYRQAIDYWRQAIAGFGDSGSVGALREGIAEARKRLGTEAAASGEVAAALTVRVELDESLRERVAPQDTVFVVARDVPGELPPLAIERASVADLPLEVTLDDDDAMAPMARLSQVDKARVTVRVSSRGEAEPQPGDLVGEAGPVALDDADAAPVRVTIDRVVD